MLVFKLLLKMIFGEKMSSWINPAIHRVKLNNSTQWIMHNDQPILFVNTPKNASSTIRAYWNMEECIFPVESNEQYSIPEEFEDQSYRVCVIFRDPLARHLSAASMLAGELEHIYGITGLDSSDFHDLHRVSDKHLVPQWAFVPMCMPPMDSDKNLMLGEDKYDWNDLYRDLIGKYGFENLINEHYDFFWLSEDPKENVWIDICKHYDMPLMDKKYNTSVGGLDYSRKDEPIKNLSKMITSVHAAYACDYDFHHRVTYRNAYLERR